MHICKQILLYNAFFHESWLPQKFDFGVSREMPEDLMQACHRRELMLKQ
jgi:hypothetical protein